jgi:hypothetical protein
MLIDPLYETALLAAVLLLLTLLFVRRRQTAAPARPPVDALDTVAAWPPQAVRVMTLPERQAHDLLRKVLPRNYVVLAQVPLARFISVPTTHPHTEWLRRVGRLSPDLLVCDGASRVVAAIDIVDADGNTERSRERRARVTKVLHSARIPVHVWNADQPPTALEVRRLFMVEAAEESREVDQAGRELVPVPVAIEQVLADGDGLSYGPDGDPVPSGFFDEPEAAPARR